MLKIFRVLKTGPQNAILFMPISGFHIKPTSRYSPISNPAIDFILNEVTQDVKPSCEYSCPNPTTRQQFAVQNEVKEDTFGDEVQISHPWPEWVGLMKKLLSRGYFDQIGNPFGSHEMGSKEFNEIRTACLNFARDRFDLIRSLSRKDIQIIAGSGCPSLDRKVVNSGKRLRAHACTDEGNVCSTCILRGDCERAYVKAREDEGGRTVDVMRFILTFGHGAITGSMENKTCLSRKVTESVRILLKEIVELSSSEELGTKHLTTSTSGRSMAKLEMSDHQGKSQINVPGKQGDWRCPKCHFLNFARNIKCLRCNSFFQERLQNLGQDYEQMPQKKGDWICDKCNFLNFAKNTWCLQCKEKPPKRQLNPGEWECESCNYLNFKRNMVCLKCDHKRPKAFNSSPLQMQSVSGNIPYRRTRPFFGEEKRGRDEGLDEFKFVETKGQDSSSSLDGAAGFIDFPVLGGKSELSQNAERWRMEMTEQNKGDAKAKRNADIFKSSFTEASCDLFQHDEEMAEWFGQKP
ncbi:OLC1v1032977C1 [Oldenlandia corymbosa var. corymbosa]|uniref:OLC1v1032977C1 n=1 Tax=Oldenlandia corymbosa var. corymbosa TaxID=529605 RepID=A0AAV1CP23_OLDCO|nr:OLC1v1032977C1 [Oldenlandia corymbosa var. corymbosa]